MPHAALASLTNSSTDRVSPRRCPSMAAAPSARSTASLGHSDESALRNVLRRCPNAACTVRE